ncbi:MAG: hypothetical protein R2831_03685 [Chitinophagaceae bacterium]
MKKYLSLTTIIIVSIVTFFSSCNKKNSSEDIASLSVLPYGNARITQTDPNEILYDNMITTVVYGIVNLTDNAEFKAVLNSEINKKFDGDDNVLLKTLSEECELQGINLEQLMTNSLLLNNKQELVQYLHDAINGFQYFEDTLYTQVFIPFRDDKDIINTISPVCMNFEDEDVMEALKKANTSILSVEIGEADAQNNTTWVVSVNETVSNKGTIGNGKPKMGGSNTRSAGDIPLWVSKINISDKKEGWGNGRAEISHITYIIRPSCIRNDFLLALPFCKLANAELNQWYEPTYNGQLGTWLSRSYVYFADWQALSYNEKLHTIFFENDRRKKFGQSVQISPCSNSDNIANFSSKEPYYGIIEALSNDFSTPDYNNPNKKTFTLNGGQFEVAGYTIQ